MQAINISYLADVDSGIRQVHSLYAILVGAEHRNSSERSRQGLLRLETIAFRQVQDWLIALLELAHLRQLAAADVLAEGMAGLFLKHTLQVPLRVTGALRHFFQRQGRFQALIPIHDKILWIVMASLLRLTSSYLFLFLRQDLLSSCSSMATSSADRFFVNSW